MEDCAIGKDFNPKTCRFIKGCRKGYSRNKDFKCVKNMTKPKEPTGESTGVVREKIKLMKNLFSNTSSNGLVNSPPEKPRTKSKHFKRSTGSKSRVIFKDPNRSVSSKTSKSRVIFKSKTPVNNGLYNSPPTESRKRSRHIKKTVKFHTIDNANATVTKTPFEIQIDQFIKKYGRNLLNLDWGQLKELARKFGLPLTSPKLKAIFKNAIIDYNNSMKELEVKIENEPEVEPHSRVEPKMLDSGTTFMFYSKSSDLKPGKGAGEHLAPEDADKFEELSKIKDWRKKLSNFWIAPFRLHGKRWASVEHYYQGSKFKGTPEFYNQFSLDSGSELSKDPVLAKAAGGKSGKFKGKYVRPKDIVIDSDFFEKKTGKLYRRSELEMNDAQNSKFLQNKHFSNLLVLTKNAKLVHYQRGGPLVIFENLMRLRSDITRQLRI